jgi:hypothetical protein
MVTVLPKARVMNEWDHSAAVARLWRGMVIGLALEVWVGAIGIVATERLMCLSRCELKSELHNPLALTKNVAWLLTLGGQCSGPRRSFA